MAEYAYLRVSSKEQNEDRQRMAIEEHRVFPEHIFVDKKSGKDFERPEYLKLMDVLKKDDLLYIVSIDRLGRNHEEIKEQWRILTRERGVDICVLDMPLLDTRLNKDLMGSFVADLVLQVLSFFSEHERNYIRSRQEDGIRAARARGVRFGRPIIKPPENFAELVKQWERGQLRLTDLLKETGLTQATFYRRLLTLRKDRKK